MANFQVCYETLLNYLKARIPFISLRTDERDRALELFRRLAAELNVTVYSHTLSQGTREIQSNRVVNEDRSVAGALDYAGQQILQRQNLTFVFTETHDIDGDTPVSRQLLDLASSATDRGGTLVVITSTPIWSRLQRQGMGLTLDLPDEDEMKSIISESIDPYRGMIPIEWNSDDVARAATILAGVTRIEADNAIATFLARGAITRDDLSKLSTIKDRIFTDISGLERVRASSSDVCVGGLAGLQSWLEKQKPLLTMDLRDRGLRPPRGLLLVGVPGCGKSLSAKFVAVAWNLPLYRLDLANIHGQYLGQSEGRLKEALGTADRVAPCVVWIDEIEKGLAGAGASNDGGTSSRLVSHFLFWLQESRARVFVLATANNISALPPELFRRGRFDEIFFVDLPSESERKEIISLYVQRYLRQELGGELLEDLVQLSNGFAGSDLEAAVAEVAKFVIVSNGDRADTEFWKKVFTNVVPFSRTNPEAVEAFQAWGRERALPASGAPLTTEQGEETRARRSVLV